MNTNCPLNHLLYNKRMNNMYIYKTTNIINNKIYIGKSTKEINESQEYYGSGAILKKSILKNGKGNFKKEIICECDDLVELNKLEKFWIKELKSQDRNIGYNITDGGDGGNIYDYLPDEQILEIKNKLSVAAKGRKPWNIGKTKETYPELYQNCNQSDITKNKISDAHKDRWNGLSYEERFGEEMGAHLRECRSNELKLRWTVEERERMSELFKDRDFSDESKQKMSNAAQERAKTHRGEKHHCFGIKQTEETKLLKSLKAKNRPKLTCPHCDKIGASSQMKRWHFDNCKFKN